MSASRTGSKRSGQKSPHPPWCRVCLGRSWSNRWCFQRILIAFWSLAPKCFAMCPEEKQGRCPYTGLVRLPILFSKNFKQVVHIQQNIAKLIINLIVKQHCKKNTYFHCWEACRTVTEKKLIKIYSLKQILSNYFI